jgi:hypothetical protein
MKRVGTDLGRKLSIGLGFRFGIGSKKIFGCWDCRDCHFDHKNSYY